MQRNPQASRRGRPAVKGPATTAQDHQNQASERSYRIEGEVSRPYTAGPYWKWLKCERLQAMRHDALCNTAVCTLLNRMNIRAFGGITM